MIKINYIFIIFLLIITLPSIIQIKSNNLSAITYDTYGESRGFGDQLKGYAQAKYISYMFNIPLLYKPFRYSDQLAMHKLENRQNKKFKKTIKINNKNFKIVEREKSYLYVNETYAKIKVDWNDTNFIKEFKEMISPLTPIKKPNLPEDRISVAVHVRKGGGFDPPLLTDKDAYQGTKKWKSYVDKVFPLKFPPDEYYIEQIKNLYHILNKIPLYVFIFTDDKNPKRIVKKYKKELEELDIIFACREEEIGRNNYVIEDFFDMTFYDCLIRGGSDFAFFVNIVGDFFISIYPEQAYWKGKNLIVDKIIIKIKPGNLYKVSDYHQNQNSPQQIRK